MTESEKVTRILEGANERLKRKSNWIRDDYAADSTGKVVSYAYPTACKFCLLGAVRATASELNESTIYGPSFTAEMTLQKAIQQLIPNHGYVAEFNDDPLTNFRDVKRVLKRAIELSKEGK